MSLPETTEEPHFEKSSFRVRKKIFATVPPDGKSLNVHVDPAEARALIEENPAAFEEIWFGKKVKTDWVQVNLAAADAVEVRELLREAWRHKAPPRVLAAFDAQNPG